MNDKKTGSAKNTYKIFATPASRYIQISVFSKNSPSCRPFLVKYIVFARAIIISFQS